MNDDTRRLYEKVLLSTQGALLGEIYPEIIAVVVGFDPNRSELLLRYYLSCEPTAADYESVSVAVAEIISDFVDASEVFKAIREECIYWPGSSSKIPTLRSPPYERLVFQRKDKNSGA